MEHNLNKNVNLKIHFDGTGDLKRKQHMVDLVSTPKIILNEIDSFDVKYDSVLTYENFHYLDACLSLLEYAEEHNLKYTLQASKEEWIAYRNILESVLTKIKKLDNAFDKAVLEKL